MRHSACPIRERDRRGSSEGSMAKKQSQSPDTDLDKTDQLPILEGVTWDHDVEDDAVRMDHTAVLPSPPALAGGVSDFVRPSTVDLPSLAESVRSVEERIARQNAEFETLTRAYERSRETEVAAVARANALAIDLGSARAALESEQRRLRDMEKTLAERSAVVEAARGRVEDALRESERHQGESRTLRESLAARETTITQVLHSLGERDAQLTLLQSEHAKMAPVLEATSKSSAQLGAELQSARAQAAALASQLQASRDAEAALAARLRRTESEASGARSELAASKTQAVSYLELLRTREWRRGFDQNLFSELDAQVGAAHLGTSALESERDRLQARVAALEAQSEAQLAAANTERVRVSAELAGRDRAIAEARERGGGDAKKVAQLLEAAELRQAEHATQLAALRGEQAAQIERLQAEAETHDQEMTVLMAHLQEARRPIQSIEADVKRLTDELAAKSAAYSHLEEESRNLRGTLERTRGQLEEREFLIRRLERSESNTANVLGRIQTSIERLGGTPLHVHSTAAAGEWTAELVRIDGERPVTYTLSRRTRIGRATGCELQIDSNSV